MFSSQWSLLSALRFISSKMQSRNSDSKMNQLPLPFYYKNQSLNNHGDLDKYTIWIISSCDYMQDKCFSVVTCINISLNMLTSLISISNGSNIIDTAIILIQNYIIFFTDAVTVRLGIVVMRESDTSNIFLGDVCDYVV